MEYSTLIQGQKIQMYHHHNSTGGGYYWKNGAVDVRSDGKYFVPQEGGPTLRITPHRMDEIREPQTLPFESPFVNGVFVGFD